jgi:hypothetical protein
MVRRAVPGSRVSASLAVVALTLAAVACADLKEATDGDRATSATDGDAGSSHDGGRGGAGDDVDPGVDTHGDRPTNAGPGEHGALPSGYCCTDDTQCRNRNCAVVGGARMCLDRCRHDSTCERYEVTFTCDSDNAFTDGFCAPPAGFECIPAARFERGTRAVGECCAATGDGRSGEECDGNLCVALGDGPFVCSRFCERGPDCPSGSVCSPFHTCVPGNTPYTCD